MGYKVQYGPSGKTEAAWQRKEHRRRKRVITLSFLAAALIFLLLTLETGKLRDFLIPGDPDITTAAFFQFTENVKSGESVADAITTFCREIIAHAQDTA